MRIRNPYHKAVMSPRHFGKFMRAVFLVLAVFSGACCAQGQETNGRPNRLIYNSDGDNMFIYKKPPMTTADLQKYVDDIVGTGVTTFSMSPNIGMVMIYRGRYARMLGDGEDQETQIRLAKDGKDTPKSFGRAASNLRSLVDAGKDPLRIIVDRVHENGMEAFISFRLNEVHSVDQPDTFPNNLILSRFWRQHPEWWIGKPGDKLAPVYQEILGPNTHPIVGSWLPGGLNYAVPEVRQRRLDQIRECCERYPIDGLELDFQRFPMYFAAGDESKHRGLMNDFVRQVRDVATSVGNKRGKPILVSARIMARPDQNLAIGLDPFTWAKEELVDFVIVSHYLRNDFPLPISDYRKRFPEKLPIYGSIEVTKDSNTYRRLARHIYDEGADGIMLFNYFTCRELGVEPDFKLLKELGNRNVAVKTE